MGLSTAMYSGVSGLKAHGEAMSVIGNNLANVSTVGFKASNMYFEDALSQSINTASGTGQLGRGVGIETVLSDFSQGSFETTNEATDVAIGGNGFFTVSPLGEDIDYYTRAGNFRLNESGYLVDPHGYVVQGWKVDNSSLADESSVNIEGIPTNIQLQNFQSPPEATEHVNMITNLNSKAVEKSSVDETQDPSTAGNNPFTAMFDTWDYDANDPSASPITSASYSYQSTLKIYDDNGVAHDLSIYYDPVNDSRVEGDASGDSYWEYMVAVPPGDDNRQFWDEAGADQSKRGVLMTGTMQFNAAGDLINTSGFTINQPYNDEDDPTSGFLTNLSDASQWTPANFSDDGYPVCTPNFLGTSFGDVTKYDDTAGDGFPNTGGAESTNINIEINFGMFSGVDSFTSPISNLSELGVTAGAIDLDNVPGMKSAEFEALKTTQYKSASTTLSQSQDGYASGFLQSISIDREGVLTGNYSNGQVLDLYALTVSSFNNEYGLNREGGNLFSESKTSGTALTGLAGTGGKGTISSNSLEQSNVDMAAEFVKMITTQKGFQANSKTITTSDTMLNTVIQLKR